MSVYRLIIFTENPSSVDDPKTVRKDEEIKASSDKVAIKRAKQKLYEYLQHGNVAEAILFSIRQSDCAEFELCSFLNLNEERLINLELAGHMFKPVDNNVSPYNKFLFNKPKDLLRDPDAPTIPWLDLKPVNVPIVSRPLKDKVKAIKTKS